MDWEDCSSNLGEGNTFTKKNYYLQIYKKYSLCFISSLCSSLFATRKDCSLQLDTRNQDKEIYHRDQEEEIYHWDQEEMGINHKDQEDEEWDRERTAPRRKKNKTQYLVFLCFEKLLCWMYHKVCFPFSLITFNGLSIFHFQKITLTRIGQVQIFNVWRHTTSLKQRGKQGWLRQGSRAVKFSNCGMLNTRNVTIQNAQKVAWEWAVR